jgi:tetratricopeptide (TPR) repeat protein
LWQLGEIQLNLDLDYARSQATFRSILDRTPSNIWMYYNLAKIALREGRTREALGLLATASALDAGYEQAAFLNSYAWLLNVMGEYAQALKVAAKGLSLAMGGAERAASLLNQAHSLVHLDRVGESEPLIAESWELNGHEKPELYIALLCKIGQRERAGRILSAVRTDCADNYALARGALALGDIDAAFEAIEVAIEDRDVLLIDSLRVAEWWDELREDPRYRILVERLASEETHTIQ